MIETGAFAIDVQGVTKRFGQKTVVNDVNLRVKYGEIYGFLGPNGSGKTTFLRMLCGLLKPDAGSGQCLGYDILKSTDGIKREMGYMTQKFSFYDDLSVRQNLDFVARAYGLPDRVKRTEQVMERLDLSDRHHQLAGQLSGGWKQRLALAACLIHQPKLLLLDEPTAGVDPEARRSFWDEIYRLSEEGVTILVTTHYMDEASRCHRLGFLVYGALLAKGAPEEIIRESGLLTRQVSGRGLDALAKTLRNYNVQAVMFGNQLRVSDADPERLARLEADNRSEDRQWREVPTGVEETFIYLMDKAKDKRS